MEAPDSGTTIADIESEMLKIVYIFSPLGCSVLTLSIYRK